MIRKRAEIKGEGIVDLAGLVMKTEIFWYDIWRRKKNSRQFLNFFYSSRDHLDWTWVNFTNHIVPI